MAAGIYPRYRRGHDRARGHTACRGERAQRLRQQYYASTAETRYEKPNQFLHTCPLESSPHTDGDFVARAANVGQAHRDGWSWRSAARHPDVHLVQTCESRSISEPQNVGHPAADCYLRRDHAAIGQAGEVNLQSFSRNCGIAR